METTKKTICILPTVYYFAFHCLDVCRKYPIITLRIISDADISAYGQRPREEKKMQIALYDMPAESLISGL